MSQDPPLPPVRRYRVPVHGNDALPGYSAGFRLSINFGSEIRFESRVLGHPHIVTFARRGLLLLPGGLAGVLRLPEGHAYGPRGDGQRLFSKLLMLEIDNAVFASAAAALQWPEEALDRLGPLAMAMEGAALPLAEALRAALADGAQPELLAPIAQAMARWILLNRDRAITPVDLARPSASAGRPQVRDAVMARVLARIEAELDQELSLQSLAEGAGMSRSHFLRAFKQSTGLTPHQHLLQARIERARQLMQATVNAGRSVRVSQIAQDAGFASHSHFSAAFRARVGVSPSDWLAGLEPQTPAEQPMNSAALASSDISTS